MTGSIFTSDDGAAVLTLSLLEAKQHLARIIDSDETARAVTKSKAHNLVRRANSNLNLGQSLYL